MEATIRTVIYPRLRPGRASRQLAAYDELVRAANEAADPKVSAAIESFQALFFNNLVLVLDRYFVHRLPGADYEGKDGNPLNEVRLVCDSLLNNGGRLRSDKQIKLPPDRSILKLKTGDLITLDESDFARLCSAFLAELQQRFVSRTQVPA